MHLFLVRHGETEENLNRIVQGHLPGRLSQTGLEQAKVIAKKLSTQKFDEIWSSDLKRCVDTTKQISAYHPNLKVRRTSLLREYSFGKFQGEHSSKLDWEIQRGEGLTRKVPGGENAMEVATRVIRFVNSLGTKQKTVLAVTHGGPMRIIKALVEKVPLGELFQSQIPNTAVWNFDINNSLDIKDLRW